jgi:hypothetical protein
MTPMANKRYLRTVAMVAAGAAIALACYSCRPEQYGQLALNFHPFVGEQPLVLDEVRYGNPGGEGSFKVRDFQFFISNIRLISKSAEFVEPESYHLVRFDSEEGTYGLVIENIPRQDYRRIEFGIGVDPTTNGTIASVGDLDPNGRMAWSWDVGYKFVLFEGALVVGDIQYPLVYHVGFDENYKQVSFELGEPLFDGPEANVDFRTDLLQMFKGAKTVDMTGMSNVKFDRADAKLLADNYASMVSVFPSRRPPSP